MQYLAPLQPQLVLLLMVATHLVSFPHTVLSLPCVLSRCGMSSSLGHSCSREVEGHVLSAAMATSSHPGSRPHLITPVFLSLFTQICALHTSGLCAHRESQIPIWSPGQGEKANDSTYQVLLSSQRCVYLKQVFQEKAANT